MVLTLQNEYILYLSNIVEVSIINVQMMHVCVILSIFHYHTLFYELYVIEGKRKYS